MFEGMFPHLLDFVQNTGKIAQNAPAAEVAVAGSVRPAQTISNSAKPLR
ncbi:MAG: hypothetical protein KatS3mg100_256 [Candidatus Parcubacteria bacterium]|jgi:hypothetical protein|nr:MAG: hypothetical protein KatS3mg100_256 [Candidatus Parcubacteria bacterium]